MAEDRDTLAATKLTRTEFAVVRAYAQGMRPVDIANRYLLDPDDDEALTEHQAVQRILALRDRLVQFALQHDRPDIAEMFEALRGRSDAGMTRRVDALSSIEQLGQGRPLPSHQVSLWFGPSLARRLVAAEIRTIADLVRLANKRGSSWWRQVPRIGRTSAVTIVRWLRNQQAFPDLKLRDFVRVPVRQDNPRSLSMTRLSRSLRQPIPLEWMSAPADPPLVAIDLGGDLRLARQWVEARAASRNTWKSYRREVERLLLWVSFQGRSLRSLDDEDLGTFREFLANPQPEEFWCGPSASRDSVDWKPFEGPLSDSSCDAAMRVVRALLNAIRGDSAQRRRRAGRTSADRTVTMPAPVTLNDSAAMEMLSTLGSSESVAESVETEVKGAEIPVGRFLAWLSQDAPSSRQRAALATALLIARHGLRIVELPGLRLGHVDPGSVTARLRIEAKSALRDGSIELDEEVWRALVAHWRDRGVVWMPEEAGWQADQALLAPTDYPATERSLAKLAAGAASYSGSGLDQLLRASWKRFAAQHEDVPTKFTPRQLRLVATSK